ncbi:MAG TPA: hypothetical protein VHP32_06595 [Ignavibacteria bacterium]|nr:hypothetical protein [Ignavibacteria bacterium]
MSENISTNGHSPGSLELFPPASIQTFIKRINNSDLNNLNEDNTPACSIKSTETLINEIESIVNLDEFYGRLEDSKQEKVTIKEIKIESDIDFLKSVKQLKTVFKNELQVIVNTIREKYQTELFNLQSIRQKETFGQPLINLIQKLNSAGYCLVMKDSVVWAYKYYEDPYEVTIGIQDTGTSEEQDEYIVEYDEHVCKIKSIYVNLMHPKITLGTIMLNTEGRHPNAQDGNGLTTVCSGDLEDREINLNNPESLISLLNEICRTYEIMNLTSAYEQPRGTYSKVEGGREAVWSSNE